MGQVLAWLPVSPQPLPLRGWQRPASLLWGLFHGEAKGLPSVQSLGTGRARRGTRILVLLCPACRLQGLRTEAVLRVPPGNSPHRELQVASWMCGILPAIADTSAALPSPTPPLGLIAFSNQQISYRAGSSCTQAWPSSCTEVGLCSLLLIRAGCHPGVSEARSQRMRWSLPVSLGTVPFERQPPCCEETKAAPRPSGASS